MPRGIYARNQNRALKPAQPATKKTTKAKHATAARIQRPTMPNEVTDNPLLLSLAKQGARMRLASIEAERNTIAECFPELMKEWQASHADALPVTTTAVEPANEPANVEPANGEHTNGDEQQQ